jgi:3-methyladenine DNA glycosylase AlkD
MNSPKEKRWRRFCGSKSLTIRNFRYLVHPPPVFSLHHKGLALRARALRIHARLMRRNKKALDNSRMLLGGLEKKMQKSDPLIQETMNWCAAEIGILDAALRDRCIRLGERLGLYKDYPVSKGCISPYLPEWITAMAGKSN